MHGNVYEWTEDCWHDTYERAPADGSAWLDPQDGDCARRVVRGGSWSGEAQNLRSANRFWIGTDVASLYVGFRLARDL